MPFIILDRDGVINYESRDYIKSPAEWHPIPGSLEAIARLNQHHFRVLVATNQSGIARGLYDVATLHLIHHKLITSLKEVGGHIEEIFFCPHHPEDDCLCRKPKAGMLHQMKDKYHLDFTQTFYIGDSYVDVQAARSVGCTPILVLTGNGALALEKHFEKLHDVPQCRDLNHAVDYVIEKKS